MPWIPTVLRRQIAGTNRAVKFDITLPCRVIPGDGIVWRQGCATLIAGRVILSAEEQCVDCGMVLLSDAEVLMSEGWVE